MASDSGNFSGSNDDSSDDAPSKCSHRKKIKPATKMDEEIESVPEEVEIEVVDSESSDEEPEVEHWRTAQKNKVSVK